MFKVGNKVIIIKEEPKYAKYIGQKGIIVAECSQSFIYDWRIELNESYQVVNFKTDSIKLDEDLLFNNNFEEKLNG